MYIAHVQTLLLIAIVHTCTHFSADNLRVYDRHSFNQHVEISSEIQVTGLAINVRKNKRYKAKMFNSGYNLVLNSTYAIVDLAIVKLCTKTLSSY